MRRMVRILLTPQPNLVSALSPLYYCSKVFGLAPYTMAPNGRGLKINKVGLAHSCIFTLAFSICLTSALWGRKLIDYNRNIITSVATWTEIYVNAFNVYIVVILVVLHRQRVLKILSGMNFIDNQLQRNYGPISYRPVRIYVLTALWFFIQTVAVMTMCTSILFKRSESRPDPHAVTMWLTRHIPPLVNCLAVLQFSTMAWVLQQRFHTLNSILRKTYTKAPSAAAPTQHRVNRIAPSSPKQPQRDSLQVLDFVFKLHHKLCDVAKDLNFVFGFQILSSLLIVFVVLLSNIYNILVTAKSNSSLGLAAYWSLVHVIVVLLIIVPSEMVKDAAIETRTILHRVRDLNPHISKAAELYSLQLLHQNVGFTACGFFRLDYTLLYTISGAITTYLVILIQFDQANRQSIQFYQQLANSSRSH